MAQELDTFEKTKQDRAQVEELSKMIVSRSVDPEAFDGRMRGAAQVCKAHFDAIRLHEEKIRRQQASIATRCLNVEKLEKEAHAARTLDAEQRVKDLKEDLKDEELRLQNAKQDLKDEKQDLKDEEQRLKDQEQRLERQEQRLKDEEQRLEQRLTEATRHLKERRPWWNVDVTQRENPSRCFAPVSGMLGASESVDWTTIDADVYKFIEDINGAKIARNVLKNELLTVAVRRVIQLDGSDCAGANTTCFVGERGGGKSHTLKLLVEAAAKKLRNVVAVYMDYSAYTDATAPLPLPSALIEEALAQRGVAVNDVEFNNMKKVQSFFRNHNLRLLLVVDEFEQAYQLPEGKSPSEARIDTFGKLLQELNDIGNSHTGECVAYLCGSSGSLPLLISARKCSVGLQQRFRLLKDAIDLNGTKYPQRHLPSTWISSEQDFVEMVHALHPKQSRDVITANARALAIVYGCNLRTLRNFRFDSKLSLKFDWGVRAEDAKEKYGKVIGSLDKALRIKNKELLDGLKAALQSPNVEAMIAKEIDVFRLAGLSRAEVKRAVHPNNLHTVDLLCDLSWYAGSSENPESKLYPNSLLALLVEHDEQLVDKARTLVASLAHLTREGAADGTKEYVADAVKIGLSFGAPRLFEFMATNLGRAAGKFM